MIEALPSEVDEAELADAPRRRFPRWRSPQLATLVEEPHDEPGWVFERKFDGVRVLVFVRDGEVHLASRNRRSQDRIFPELRDECARRVGGDCILDGEVVAFDGRLTSFQRLQGRLHWADARTRRRIAVYLYCFDIIQLGDRDCGALPLPQRKRLLRETVDFGGHVRWTRYRRSDGLGFFERACRRGWEGLIAKREDAPYRHGRSRDWQKFKCAEGQEMVVVGFTEPEGERRGFGALIIAFYDDGGRLRYAGRVGTGFDREDLARLSARLRRLERATPPLDGEHPETGDDVHWVRPELVAEVGFTEWTRDLRLRHPRFRGLRTDKDPREVRRENGRGR